MSFLKSQGGFPLNFASSLVSWTHNSSEIFELNHYMFFTKRVHQCTIFQTFECSNESFPNSSYHFCKQKVRVYSNLSSLFSVMKGNSSVVFQFKLHILWTEKDHRSEIFRLLSGWVKIHQIFHVIFKTTGQFFLKLCITLKCHEK